MSGRRSILSGTNLFRFSWCQVHLAWRSAQRAREVGEGGGEILGRVPVSCSKGKRENTVSEAVLCCVHRRVECVRG